MRVNCKVLFLGLLAMIGCSDEPASLRPPDWDPKHLAKAAIAAYDANENGIIAADEFDSCPGLRDMVSAADSDEDGGLTADEITTRIQLYKKMKAVLLPFGCRVQRNGRPLAGATVRLVPESFLGDLIPPAVGTTDDQGWVSPSVDDPEYASRDMRGVRMGVYRVEITMPDSTGAETISPRYNTQTTMGLELAMGHHMHGETVLELND